MLSAVDLAALQRALTGWVLTRHRQQRPRVRPRGEQRTVLAVDGKTLRGARDQAGRQTKLVAVLDHTERLALAQIQVADGDELAAFVPVLNTLADLHDVVVTAPMRCTARARTPSTCTPAARTTCSPSRATSPGCAARWPGLPWAQAPGLRERSSGHGRAESRSIKVLDLDNTPEAKLFPPGARAIKVVRRRRRTGHPKPSVETVYAITSLGHRDANPRLLAGWIRSHWTIENCLHWVRDATEGEDHSSVRTGHGPQVMAALRNTAINIIRLRGGTNIAAAHRHFSYRPADVHDALTGGWASSTWDWGCDADVVDRAGWSPSDVCGCVRHGADHGHLSRGTARSRGCVGGA